MNGLNSVALVPLLSVQDIYCLIVIQIITLRMNKHLWLAMRVFAKRALMITAVFVNYYV